jgi:hypothetical protein
MENVTTAINNILCGCPELLREVDYEDLIVDYGLTTEQEYQEALFAAIDTEAQFSYNLGAADYLSEHDFSLQISLRLAQEQYVTVTSAIDLANLLIVKRCKEYYTNNRQAIRKAFEQYNTNK